MSNTPDEIVIEKNFHQSVDGYYKASVMDENYNVVSTTEWKHNLITNNGLDMIAHVPWAQAAQFCIAGNHPSPTAAAVTDLKLQRPYAINGFWLVGSGNCGASLEQGVYKLRRTYDFYKEPSHVKITEVGFKPTMACPYLFSRVVLNPAQNISAGQFLRINYELHVNVAPTGLRVPNPIPVISGGWGAGDQDKETLQLLGMCGINTGTSEAEPYDAGGFANEAFAPGTRNFGPGWGFCNRWVNGSAVNYCSGSSPTGDVGPMYNYAYNYKNPHQYIREKFSQTINSGEFKGSLVVGGRYINYYDTGFIADMAAVHGYTASPADLGLNGARTLNISPGSDQDAIVSVNNLTHLPSPLAKLAPVAASPYYHSLNETYFDPALGVPQTSARVHYSGGYQTQAIEDTYYFSKSYIPWMTGVDSGVVPVPEPLQDKPLWDDWVGTNVAGASCFMSTNGVVPTGGVGSYQPRTGVIVELPLRLDPYISGTYARTKYCLFDTMVGNNDSWKSIGIGPTTNAIVPSQMTGAAATPAYVYVFATGNAKSGTHQLKLQFRTSWSRA